MAKRLVKEMVVFKDDPFTGDSATYISVENDGGGAFFEIRQPAMEEFVAQKGIVRFNFNEIEEIYDAMKVMKAQWEMEGF